MFEVRNLMARAQSLTVLAVTVVSLFSLSVAARAYDMNDCTRLLDTFAMQQFSIEAGGADFGDLPHLGGAPLGTAAICWSPGGRVGIIGKLFADNLCLPFRPCTPITAIAKIRFQRANGNFFNAATRRVLSQQELNWGEIRLASPQGNFKGVNIRLFTFQSATIGNTLVAERNFQR
jgi:hypothetical protein